MPGFSVTLLLLPDANSNLSADFIVSLLDEPTDTPGWKWSSRSALSCSLDIPGPKPADQSFTKSNTVSLKAADSSAFINAIGRACNKLIEAEPEITRMDTIAGDGDCGLTLKGGADSLLKSIAEGKVSGNDVIGSFIEVSTIAEEQMGGTSGALYSFVNSALP
jgi:dihydroxyacetone kinase